jgi:poly(3-hydroxybutyrate) depolymerase
MDLTAEFYLQTVEKVFVEHELPKGEMMHRDKPVDLMSIRRCAIMAIEGEKDDITGIGQTRAALDLTLNLSAEKKAYHLQMGAGHYGIFNGSRFRTEIAPKIVAFMEAHAEPAMIVPPISLGHLLPDAAEPDLSVPAALLTHGPCAASEAARALYA